MLMYRAFSYDGKRQMSRQIIDGVAEYVKLPEVGRCLDVGCGSGALAIAVAKRNPHATVIGIDRWGAEYASFSKRLCEDNARAEGVENITSFAQGDAMKLDFPNGTFDAVTSNYVYHNIPSSNRQAILLETLRVLKKRRHIRPARYLLKSKIWRYALLCEETQRDGLREGGTCPHGQRPLHDQVGSHLDGPFRIGDTCREEVIRLYFLLQLLV